MTSIADTGKASAMTMCYCTACDHELHLHVNDYNADCTCNLHGPFVGQVLESRSDATRIVTWVARDGSGYESEWVRR